MTRDCLLTCEVHCVQGRRVFVLEANDYGKDSFVGETLGCQRGEEIAEVYGTGE